MNQGNYLKFKPKEIECSTLNLGHGKGVQVPIGLMQKLAAIRVYKRLGG